MPLDDSRAERFILENTAIAAPPLLPAMRLYLATEITPIWLATEAALEQAGVEPPFWAFPWAGGQALARYVTDNPSIVAGQDVLDFGAGAGLIAIAAAQSGARRVRAADIDPIAGVAMRLNAALNNVAFEFVVDDIVGTDTGAEIVLVGDMCYERKLAERMIAWLRGLAASGVIILLGDPGRTYRPSDGLAEVARYVVPTSLELEDRTERETVVWRLLPS